MSPEIENHIDWVAASTPLGEQVGPGLSRPRAKGPAPLVHRRAGSRQGATADTQRSIVEKLLGQNNLAAPDERGNDPYNATGRQFRR